MFSNYTVKKKGKKKKKKNQEGQNDSYNYMNNKLTSFFLQGYILTCVCNIGMEIRQNWGGRRRERKMMEIFPLTH